MRRSLPLLVPCLPIALLYMANPAAVHAQNAPTPKDSSPWSGSAVSIKHSAQLYGFGVDPDFNPTILQSLSIDPTWRYSERLQLTAHLGIETELTNSDVTSSARQPLLEDTTTTATLALPELGLGLRGRATFRVALPTSKEAIGRRRLAALSPGVVITRPYSLGPWSITPSVALRATWNWQLSTTLVYDGPTISGCDPARSACEAFDHAGQRSTAFGFAEVLGVTVARPESNVTMVAQLWWTQAWLYDLAEIDGPDGMPVEPSERNTDWRLGMVSLVAVEWQARPHVRFGAGLETQNPLETPDGGVYRPFFNRFTHLSLTATAVF
jgi:hypothetical protein